MKRSGEHPIEIVIVGGGFGGFFAAKKLAKLTKRLDVRITMVSSSDGMLYQPLLPDVAVGAMDPRTVSVPLTRTLKGVRVARGYVTVIDLDAQVLTAQTAGPDVTLRYDLLLLAPGAVTRLVEIPGLKDHAVGFKSSAEALYLRELVLQRLETANSETDVSRRQGQTTFVVVGGGYAGTELTAQMARLTNNLLPSYTQLAPDSVRWLLLDTATTLMPELGTSLGLRALDVLKRRGVEVLLGTSVSEVRADSVTLTDGRDIACSTVIWCAGVTASPLVHATGLPTERDRLIVDANLSVPGHPEIFAIGDAAAVPDLTNRVDPSNLCPPTAQHAMRQGTAAAKNLAALIAGRPTRPYRHRDLGLVVDLGGWTAVASPLGIKLRGVLAKAITRAYHLYALPTMRRRISAAISWALAGRQPNDISLGVIGLTEALASRSPGRAIETVQHPRPVPPTQPLPPDPAKRQTTAHSQPTSEGQPVPITVTTSDQLLAAAASGDTHIVVDGTLSGMPMITLKPGVTLSGGTLRFGARGIQLTSDNTVSGTRILCPDHEVAISNELDNPSLGTITLTKVETTGQVLLLADGKVTAGSVVIDDLTVLSADVTGRSDRPHGYGVDALQGAFTLWNRQSDPTSEISAQLRDIKVGSVDCPVRGSGIFVGGYGDREGRPTGGRVNVTELTTGDVVSNGGIAEGTPDLISGGVFVQVGAVVDLVRNIGAVTTLGANDMVLDNWGEVREWVAEGAITSRGPSGIGFVNFGKLGTLEVSSPIETWGQGARGFNLYDGSLEQATFDSITTHGDGAVGMQITKPLPKVRVNGDIRTTGGEGTSLVRGQQVLLKAIAFSLKVGGSLQSLEVSGTVESTGDNVITMEVHGPISALTVSGGVSAQGKGSDAVHASGDTARIEALTLYSADGVTLVHTPEA